MDRHAGIRDCFPPCSSPLTLRLCCRRGDIDVPAYFMHAETPTCDAHQVSPTPLHGSLGAPCRGRGDNAALQGLPLGSPGLPEDRQVLLRSQTLTHGGDGTRPALLQRSASTSAYRAAGSVSPVGGGMWHGAMQAIPEFIPPGTGGAAEVSLAGLTVNPAQKWRPKRVSDNV